MTGHDAAVRVTPQRETATISQTQAGGLLVPQRAGKWLR
jgi:hypothetical protein